MSETRLYATALIRQSVCVVCPVCEYETSVRARYGVPYPVELGCGHCGRHLLLEYEQANVDNQEKTTPK